MLSSPPSDLTAEVDGLRAALTQALTKVLDREGTWEDLVKAALRGGPRFLLETDYIDDPRRPGAVLGPATVPRKTRAWLESGVLREEEAWRIHKDLPERTYRIEFRG